MALILDARVKQKVATEAEWMAEPTILLEGEQAFVKGGDGNVINFKIGDGTKAFADLAYAIDYNAFAGIAPQALTPSDPNPTGAGIYIPTIDGTYTNAGGLTVDRGAGGADEGTYVQFINDSGTWYKINTPLPEGKIRNWVAGTYPQGAQVNHNGQIWEATTGTSQEPGTGAEWEVVIKPVNDLVSGGVDKPLSAEQGVEIITILKNTGSVIAEKGSEVDTSGTAWTPNSFIKSDGGIGGTVLEFSASDYISVPGAGNYRYNGYMNVSHAIAFYAPDNSVLGSYPAPSTVTSVDFTAPEGTVKIRVTCKTDQIPVFAITLMDYITRDAADGMILSEDYAIVEARYNIDGILEGADVAWRDGTPGVLEMQSYNDAFMSYDGYTVTYNGTPPRTLVQPGVSRDVDGNIIIRPLKYIE